MSSSRDITTIIEGIHLRYLENNFDLRSTAHERISSCKIIPDLVNKDKEIKTLFELKSKTYPINNNKNANILQFAWWYFRGYQIAEYERFSKETGIPVYMILMIATTNNHPTTVKVLTEKIFLERQIYVVPLSVHELVKASDKEPVHEINRGGKKLGLNRLIDAYEFSEYNIKKGTLFLEKNSLESLEKYFGMIQ
ncbi:MAG: hypothetical protein ACP5N3_05940 [Candidatus Nanoarchaeia archaeon]